MIPFHKTKNIHISADLRRLTNSHIYAGINEFAQFALLTEHNFAMKIFLKQVIICF